MTHGTPPRHEQAGREATAVAGPGRHQVLRDAGLVALAALAVRLAARLATGFDGLYGQDPFAYWTYAIELRHALLGGHLPPPFSWPLGYPLLVAAATMLVGEQPLAGQLVSLICGTAVAALVVVLVRQLAPAARAGAVIAGLLAAAAAQPVIWSLTVNSDSAGVALLLISALAMMQHTDRAEARWLALAAAALAGAVLCRWVYAVAALPWVAAAAVGWRDARVAPRRAAALLVLAAGIGAAMLAAELAPGLLRGKLAHARSFEVYSWSPASAFRSTVRNADGLFRYRFPAGVFYALPLVHPSYVFPLLSPFLALGAVALVRARRAHAVLVAGWAATVYVFLAGLPWQSPRFSLSFFPALAAAVGLGVDRALRAAPARRARAAVVGVCVLGLAGSLAWTVRDVRRFTGDAAADREAVRWVESHLPKGATLVAFGLTATARHLTRLRVVELFHETPAGVQARACGGEPVFLVLDPGGAATQWVELAPGRSLVWLHDRGALDEIGRSGRYALWRIRCVDGGDAPGEH